MMVTIAPSKGSSESSENHDQDVQVEEDDETVEPTQAPPILEEGGQATQDDLLEINLGTDEEPRPNSSAEVCRQKKGACISSC